MRWIRRAALVAAFLFIGPVAFIAGFAAWFSENTRPTDVIVVLGAGMDADGTLHRSSLLRVEKGVSLFRAGLAPHMHFTGGRGTSAGPSAGQQMARLAAQLGVPETQLSFEQESQSTLQNALFSHPQLQGHQSLRLVTEGFHLPRSWLSFKWANVRSADGRNIELSISERFRSSSPKARLPQVSMVIREGLALWFNLGRAAIHGGAGLIGVERATRDRWLA